MGRFNQNLIDSGIMRAGEGLRPSPEGKRVVFEGEDRIVREGPFEATGELVAGFWLWEVKDMDEALAWARRCPNTMPDGGELEIRPLFEAEDFGETIQSSPAVRHVTQQSHAGSKATGNRCVLHGIRGKLPS